ncbi:MAG: cytochrome c peroxidase [Pseudomonadota bacterium]|nr:cytochrome c peroxidase [Pseudomonadota bacterium]
MRNLKSFFEILTIFFLAYGNAPAEEVSVIALGEKLFSNPNLSKNRNISCETCHNSNTAFIDNRLSMAEGSVSQGTSHDSFGRRNAPTLTYASLTPPIRTLQKETMGGLFFDGRADTFEEQIIHPLFAADEMGLSNNEMLLSRIKEDPDLKDMFITVFGETILNDANNVLKAVQTAIATFERSAAFSSFDSKYDRFLEGTYTLTPLERKGYRLFFSDVTNCMNCHLLHKGTLSRREPFTDQRYHNIGIPKNRLLLKKKFFGPSYLDSGLAENPVITSGDNIGKFRTPTLRNVAVTPPYMHNGVFKTLETTIHFYNRHLIKNHSALINPETKKIWDKPEIERNIDETLLGLGQPLNEDRTEQLVAFLRLLTDKRYENLLK